DVLQTDAVVRHPLAAPFGGLDGRPEGAEEMFVVAARGVHPAEHTADRFQLVEWIGLERRERGRHVPIPLSRRVSARESDHVITVHDFFWPRVTRTVRLPGASIRLTGKRSRLPSSDATVMASSMSPVATSIFGVPALPMSCTLPVLLAVPSA